MCNYAILLVTVMVHVCAETEMCSLGRSCCRIQTADSDTNIQFSLFWFETLSLLLSGSFIFLHLNWYLGVTILKLIVPNGSCFEMVPVVIMDISYLSCFILQDCINRITSLEDMGMINLTFHLFHLASILNNNNFLVAIRQSVIARIMDLWNFSFL